MTAGTVSLSPELIEQIAQYCNTAIRRSPGVQAAALFTLSAQCVWASDQSIVHIAPNVARIGIASLRLWAKLRPGRVERVGLMTGDGLVELVFVPPLASLLVVSGQAGRAGWPEGEPEGIVAALGL